MATLAVVFPVLMVGQVLPNAGGSFLFDFGGDLYAAGHAIVHGVSPYHPDLIASQAAMVRAGGTAVAGFAVPVYPPPILVALAPFSLLPYYVAGAFFLIASAGALILSLWLLGVRDWRCFALAVASWPAVYGVWLGTLSPLLMLGVAVAWRWRSRLWTPAIAIASVVAAKLFLWPLGIWLLATRRLRVLGFACLLAVAGILLAWAAIGFAGFTAYPHMLANLTEVEQSRGPSFVAALLSVGLPSTVARCAALASAGGLLILAFLLGRQSDGDRRAFALAVMAALIGSPVVWAHYLVLLFVPIALVSPRVSPIWFVPIVMYIVPRPEPDRPVQMLVWLTIELLVVVRICAGPRLQGLPTWLGRMRRQRPGKPLDSRLVEPSICAGTEAAVSAPPTS